MRRVRLAIVGFGVVGRSLVRILAYRGRAPADRHSVQLSVVRREVDRPQPHLGRLEGDGMSVIVGRVREDRALGGVKYVALGHNTIRGAAGTGVLIAELLVARGLA